jgi:glycosyltransferase involved in cell wall biosynthesis
MPVLGAPESVKITHYYPKLLVQETGVANAVLGWSRALTEAGVPTSIIVDEDAIHIPPPRDIECVFVKHVGRGRLRVPARIPPLGSDEPLLVIHGGWKLSDIIAGRQARRQGVPYTVTPHGVYHPMVLDRRAVTLRRAWFSALEKPHLGSAAAIHVFYADEIEHLVSLGVQAPVIVAANGITPPEGVLWDGGSGGYLLWLGRYDPVNKGLDVLLRGLRLLPDADRLPLRLHGRDWHGGRTEVDRLVRELGLQHTVAVGDPIYGEAKWHLMAQAVGFAYPSRWEASPVAVAEAVSIGTPTLVADYPMGRFLASRGGAHLIDLTPASVKAGIAWLRSAEARESGKRGREVARFDLSWHEAAKSWLGQMRTILEHPKG